MLTEAPIPVAQPSRRLPVYILADRSSSMLGEAIVQVNQGLQFIKSDLETEPRAVETVWISVISFGGQATMDVSLTELMAFTPPTLKAEGNTPLGAALRLLNQSIDHDVLLNTGQHTGDWKPLIFLFTDGEPTDDWRVPAGELKARTRAKAANIIAVGCGSSANVTMLKEITETVMLMKDVNPRTFADLMKWISSSVKTVTQATQGADPGDTGNQPAQAALPALPQGFVIPL